MGTGVTRSTTRAIYDFIWRHEPATKNEIAAALGISLPTVSKYLTYFAREGLIDVGSKLSSGARGGRIPIGYVCRDNGRFAIGLDVTAERTRCVVLNVRGEVLANRRTPRAYSRDDDYFRFLGEEVAAVVEESGIDERRILGVSIGVPGLIDEASGVLYFGRVIDNLGLSVADFGRYIPYPSRLVHDSEAAGFAEFWERPTDTNAYYISLGKSVGGSFHQRAASHRGERGLTSEVGHMRIHPNGRLCYCGRRGCMDPYCNSRVLAASGDGSVTAFFDRLRSGDADAADAWDSYTTDLAVVIHNVRVMFGSRIILGGDVGAKCGPDLGPLWDKVDELSFLPSDSRSFLRACTVTEYPIALGSALYVVDQFRNDPDRFALPRSRARGA